MKDKKKPTQGKDSSINDKKKKTTTKNIGFDIVQKIKDEQISPKPKIFFLTKNLLLWALFVFAIVVASIATGILIYGSYILQSYFFFDLPFCHKLRLISVGIPIFWIAILILAFFIAIKCFRSTKRGYKLPTIILVLLAVLSFIVIGITLFIRGTVERFDSDGNFPPFVHIRPRHEELWINPTRGLIGGKIIDIEEDNLAIVLLNNQEWTVETTNASMHRSMQPLAIGQFIRALGSVREKNVFIAEKIFPSFDRESHREPRLHPTRRYKRDDDDGDGDGNDGDNDDDRRKRFRQNNKDRRNKRSRQR